MTASSANSLLSVVESWGGFEEFIAELNKTGEVIVKRNVVLTGTMGVPRQIDVLVVHKQGLYEHRILIECKFWKTKIKRFHVDAMITAMSDLKASKGVFFTTKGCQSGAAQMAQKNNVAIFRVRDIATSEWGAPGRNIHLYLQFFGRSTLKFEVPDATLLMPSPYPCSPSPRSAFRVVDQSTGRLECEVRFGETETQLYSAVDASPRGILEQILDEQSLRVLKEKYKEAPVVVLPESSPKMLVEAQFRLNFEPNRIVPMPGGPRAGCVVLKQAIGTLGFLWSQTEFRYDRMTPYEFAAVVEDCVTNEKSLATRRHNEATTRLAELASDTPPPPDALQNGMVFRVLHEGWFTADDCSPPLPPSTPPENK